MRGKKTVPPWLRFVPLIFADEAHQSMTDKRMPMLEDTFDPACVRMAFTATPDYSAKEDRMLSTYFPRLLHEMPVSEAFESNLLAKPKSWVHEVDVDASSVTIRAGEYDEAELARVMSSAPVFKKTCDIRYAEQYKDTGALIACTSVQEALDLQVFMRAHKPQNSVDPIVIVGDTTTAERETHLNQFEAEPGHTLIVVGTLIQGWDSKRCKLLVSLAASRSLVKSKQLFFRPLTKDGNAEGHIHLIIPRDLPGSPILPNDVFGKSVEQVEVRLTRTPISHPSTPTKASQARQTGIVVESARIAARTVIDGAELPTLVPTRDAEVKAVIQSSFTLRRGIPSRYEFTRSTFHHDLFTGTGKQLLAYLGAHTNEQYTALMQRLYPEQAADTLLNPHAGIAGDEFSTNERDVAHMLNALYSGEYEGSEGYADGWRTLFGPDAEQTAEEALIAHERIMQLRAVIQRLHETVDTAVLARVYELKYIEENSYHAVGNQLQKNDRQVRLLEDKLKEFISNHIALLVQPSSQQPSRERSTQRDGLSTSLTPDERWKRFIEYRKEHYEATRLRVIALEKKRGNLTEMVDKWPERWEDSQEYKELHRLGGSTRASFDAFFEERKKTALQNEVVSPPSTEIEEAVQDFWNIFLEHRRTAWPAWRDRERKMLGYNDAYMSAEDKKIIESRFPERWEDSKEHDYIHAHTDEMLDSIHKLFS